MMGQLLILFFNILINISTNATFFILPCKNDDQQLIVVNFHKKFKCLPFKISCKNNYIRFQEIFLDALDRSDPIEKYSILKGYQNAKSDFLIIRLSDYHHIVRNNYPQFQQVFFSDFNESYSDQNIMSVLNYLENRSDLIALKFKYLKQNDFVQNFTSAYLYRRIEIYLSSLPKDVDVEIIAQKDGPLKKIEKKSDIIDLLAVKKSPPLFKIKLIVRLVHYSVSFVTENLDHKFLYYLVKNNFSKFKNVLDCFGYYYIEIIKAENENTFCKKIYNTIIKYAQLYDPGCCEFLSDHDDLVEQKAPNLNSFIQLEEISLYTFLKHLKYYLEKKSDLNSDQVLLFALKKMNLIKEYIQNNHEELVTNLTKLIYSSKTEEVLYNFMDFYLKKVALFESVKHRIP